MGISLNVEQLRKNAEAQRQQSTKDQVEKKMQQAGDYQARLAENFRSNIPQMAAQELSDYRQNIGQQLAQGRKNLNANFNQRGMLYSGKRASEDAGLQGDAQSSIAQAAYQIPKGLYDQADQMDLGATSTYMGAGNMVMQGQQQAQQIQNQALQNRLSYWNQFGQGLGQLGGAGLYAYSQNKNIGDVLRQK